MPPDITFKPPPREKENPVVPDNPFHKLIAWLALIVMAPLWIPYQAYVRMKCRKQGHGKIEEFWMEVGERMFMDRRCIRCGQKFP